MDKHNHSPAHRENALILMICFARSGGTLLNKCLGCLPGVVIMSEVNPAGGGAGRGTALRTIGEQAREWYGISLSSQNFTDSVLELHDICLQTGRRLIIRDWTFINFSHTGGPGRLLALEALQEKTNIIPFAFVRDAVDVWISRGMPAAEEFFTLYLCYIRRILDHGIRCFKYEDFCRSPEKVLGELCAMTRLVFSANYKKYASFSNVNGDVQTGSGSRGMRQRAIAPILRRRIPQKKIDEVNDCLQMSEANRLMGYPHYYEGRPVESRFHILRDTARKYLQRLIAPAVF